MPYRGGQPHPSKTFFFVLWKYTNLTSVFFHHLLKFVYLPSEICSKYGFATLGIRFLHVSRLEPISLGQKNVLTSLEIDFFKTFIMTYWIRF